MRQGAGSVNADGLPIDSKISGWTKHGTERVLSRDGGVEVSSNAIFGLGKAS